MIGVNFIIRLFLCAGDSKFRILLHVETISTALGALRVFTKWRQGFKQRKEED